LSNGRKLFCSTQRFFLDELLRNIGVHRHTPQNPVVEKDRSSDAMDPSPRGLHRLRRRLASQGASQRTELYRKHVAGHRAGALIGADLPIVSDDKDAMRHAFNNRIELRCSALCELIGIA
jgi:hypothetical protein